jgi:hypothetical protein
MQDDVELGTAVEATRSHALLQAAQKRREKRESHLFLDLPSWNGDMIGEYRLIPKDQFEKLAARVASKLRTNSSDTTAGDIELIVHSCVALYVRDPDSGDRVPIEDEFGVVDYGRIAGVLGVEDEIQNTTDAVRYMTAERDDEDGSWTENVEAISRHAQRISTWMRDPSKRTVDIQDILSELA